MATYLILNCIVIIAVGAGLIGTTRVKRARGLFSQKLSQAGWIALAALIILTLAFDNLLILLGMYSYAPEKILGIHLWLAPIEDFMYPLLAALIVPAVWNITGVKKNV